MDFGLLNGKFRKAKEWDFSMGLNFHCRYCNGISSHASITCFPIIHRIESFSIHRSISDNACTPLIGISCLFPNEQLLNQFSFIKYLVHIISRSYNITVIHSNNWIITTKFHENSHLYLSNNSSFCYQTADTPPAWIYKQNKGDKSLEAFVG